MFETMMNTDLSWVFLVGFFVFSNSFYLLCLVDCFDNSTQI